MGYAGVIFDLDGTLVDTLDDLADSVNEALSQLGYPEHAVGDYKLKVGRGFRNLIESSLPDGTDEQTVDACLELFVKAYDRRYLAKSRPYEGIVGLLGELSADGVLMGINSNKRTDYTQKIAQTLFPQISFSAVIGERAGVPRKPDPTGALEICSAMGLDRSDILYVGDSSTDMKTGKNAGLDTVGVAWGFRGPAELRENGADLIAYSIDDVRDAVRNGIGPAHAGADADIL